MVIEEHHIVDKDEHRGVSPLSGGMMESFKSRFRDWYEYGRRLRSCGHEAESSTNFELGARCKDLERVDSGISLGTSIRFHSCHNTPEPKLQPQNSSSIQLKIDFGDQTCVKSLDYGTFSRWSAIEGLMIDMEEDGILCEELWDVAESMRVCRGDWDARVRPGWDIHVLCQQTRPVLDTPYHEYDTDSDSETAGSEGYHWFDDVLDHYQEDWCLPRWRERVELEKTMRIAMKDPSWAMLALGCTTIALFIIGVIIYTP